MNTRQSYKNVAPGATAPTLYRPTPVLPVESQNPDSDFLRLLGTLTSIYHLSRNDYFLARYEGMPDQMSLLTANLSHILAQVDPLVLEALESRTVESILNRLAA